MFSLFRHDVAPPVAMAWPVVYRRLRQAKRLTLRVDSAKRQIVVSHPWRTAQREAEKFVAAQSDWLAAQIGQVQPAYRLAVGESVPVHGVLRRIVAGESAGRGVQVRLTDDALVVAGNPDRAPRAVYRFLKALAETEIRRLTAEKMAALNALHPVAQLHALTFRDTTTRWGSCTSTGEINVCWRLILAPPEVLDYVVGHEAAHLVHMHHQASFWALCRQLTPYTTLGKAWLKGQGNGLRLSLA